MAVKRRNHHHAAWLRRATSRARPSRRSFTPCRRSLSPNGQNDDPALRRSCRVPRGCRDRLRPRWLDGCSPKKPRGRSIGLVGAVDATDVSLSWNKGKCPRAHWIFRPALHVVRKRAHPASLYPGSVSIPAILPYARPKPRQSNPAHPRRPLPRSESPCPPAARSRRRRPPCRPGLSLALPAGGIERSGVDISAESTPSIGWVR